MKIVLAIGHSKVESTIEKQLPDHCEVVGVAAYREAILTKLRENPGTNVVLIRDNLQGEMKILTLIHQIRAEFNNCRIILMTKNREAGDPFLSAVVSYAVWDIILGYKVSVSHMIDYILNPRTFKDVERFQKRVLIDETTPTTEVSETSQVSSSTELIVNDSTAVSNPFPIEAEGENNKPIPAVYPSSSTTPLSSPADYPTSSTFKTEPVIRKGSMREQLLKQMEQTNSVPFTEGTTEPLTTVQASANPSFSFEAEQPSVSPTPFTPMPPSFSLESQPSEVKKTTVPTFGFHSVTEEAAEEELKESKKSKLFPTKDIESIGKPLVGHRPAFNNQIKNSPIVMSLIGFKGGVGTSQTAFNLAVHLAKQKNKVLYVELNDHSLPLTYLYNLSTLRGGLEEALKTAHHSTTQDFSPYLTRFSHLKQTQRERDMQLLLKPYPDTLDFLNFSHFFVLQEKEEYYPEELKSLLSDLLLSEGYQYIILDVNIHSHPTLVSQALRSSKYICPVITQDMVSVGQTVERLKSIHQHQFPLHQKIQFILNRYDHTCNSDKSLLKWINSELPFKPLGIWSVPDGGSAYAKANEKSKPVVLASPPKPILQAFETLHNYLKTM